jgi:predicted RND superfamily exporter protein
VIEHARRLRPHLPRWGRGRALAALMVVLLTAPLVWGLAHVRIETDLASFLPKDDPQLGAYQRYTEDFGSDPIVVLVEAHTDTALLAPDQLGKLLELEGRLSRLRGVASVYGPATSLNQIAVQAQALVAELVGRRDAQIAQAEVTARKGGASRSAAAAAGERARTAFDGRYGPLLVQAMPAGLPTLKNPKFAQHLVFDGEGRPRAQWRYLVPGRHALAIIIRPSADLDAAATSRVVRSVDATVAHADLAAVRTTITGSPVVVDALSRRSTTEAPLLGALAVATIALCLCAGRRGRLLRRLAPLAITCGAVAATLGLLGLLGRPLSLGVVAFCPVLLGIGVYYPSYFALGARTRTVLTVALATAASLATLGLSPLPIVRDLGLTLAVGVLVAAGLGWLARRGLASTDDTVANEEGAPAGSATGFPPSAVTIRSRVPLVLALAVAAVVAGVGWSRAAHLRVESDVAYFAGGLSALQKAEHVEEVMGSSGEIDLVAEGAVTSPQVLAWQTEAQRTIATKQGERFRSAVSLAGMLDFLGARPTQDEINAGLRMFPAYLTSSVLSPDRTKAVSSFGVRLDDLPRLGDDVARIDRELAAAPDGTETRLVGLPLVLVRAQELVAADRLAGSLWGIAAAVAVLLVGLRRRSDALRAAAAALIATGLTFATLALAGRALDPVTASLGALTAAVGCEFTIVYAEAVRRRSRRLRGTVLLVAASSTAGYLVLLGSGLAAVRGLGLLLAVAVLQALVAAVLVVAATVTPPSRETEVRHDHP